MFEFIKYSIWPIVKVRVVTIWWIIKYGGKRSIPHKLIFNKMQKSLENLNKNLMDALRIIPNDISEGKKKELMYLIKTGAQLDREVKQAITKKEV